MFNLGGWTVVGWLILGGYLGVLCVGWGWFNMVFVCVGRFVVWLVLSCLGWGLGFCF